MPAKPMQLAFRIAFAASVGFTLGYVLGWDFPFVPPLFAVQLLTASKSLNLRQARRLRGADGGRLRVQRPYCSNLRETRHSF